jgi:hypothetical protein
MNEVSHSLDRLAAATDRLLATATAFEQPVASATAMAVGHHDGSFGKNIRSAKPKEKLWPTPGT